MSVHYNPTEKLQIVNYKKGIAAAFQANFKKTAVEIEEDTQSRHYSHYRFVILPMNCGAILLNNFPYNIYVVTKRSHQIT